jgi:hypothetical protein
MISIYESVKGTQRRSIPVIGRRGQRSLPKRGSIWLKPEWRGASAKVAWIKP